MNGDVGKMSRDEERAFDLLPTVMSNACAFRSLFDNKFLNSDVRTYGGKQIEKKKGYKG